MFPSRPPFPKKNYAKIILKKDTSFYTFMFRYVFWLKRSTHHSLRISIIYSSLRDLQYLALVFYVLLQTIVVQCINLCEETSLGKPCTCEWGLTKKANVNKPLQCVPISLIVFLVNNFSSCNIDTCNSPLFTLSM